MTTYEIERENVWYIETWDVQLQGWTGVHPYTEWGDEALAVAGYLKHKKKTPGGSSHLVRENRSRYVVTGDREPVRGAARSRGGL